jgi:hypothetical protein
MVCILYNGLQRLVRFCLKLPKALRKFVSKPVSAEQTYRTPIRPVSVKYAKKRATFSLDVEHIVLASLLVRATWVLPGNCAHRTSKPTVKHRMLVFHWGSQTKADSFIRASKDTRLHSNLKLHKILECARLIAKWLCVWMLASVPHLCKGAPPN